MTNRDRKSRAWSVDHLKADGAPVMKRKFKPLSVWVWAAVFALWAFISIPFFSDVVTPVIQWFGR